MTTKEVVKKINIIVYRKGATFSMKCTLMNKNTEVLLCEFNEVSKFFDEIYDVYNIDYAPYILKSFYISDDINDIPFRTNLSEWFKGRGILS